MDRRSLFAASAAALLPSRGLAAPAGRYRVGLHVFLATPEPGVPFDPVDRPPFLQALEAGVAIPLDTKSRPGFLESLARQAPGYTLRGRLGFFAAPMHEGGVEFEFPLPPPHLTAEGDASLRASISIRRATATQVRLLTEGTLTAPAGPGSEPGRWRWRRRYLADLGKAYAAEVIGSSAGYYLAIVVSVQAASR